jgi:hypothetical protein
MSSPLRLCAQELDVSVKVIVQGAIQSDPLLFQSLERNLNEFINTTKWTEDIYEPEERIKGSIQITITAENTLGNMEAEMIVQSERPVYGSSYKSPMITWIDKNIDFTWNGQTPFVKTQNVFVDNLSAIMSYYAYLLIGIDMDSFSTYGGDALFKKAQDIITSLPPNFLLNNGWRKDGGTKKNRFWLIENLLHPRMKQYRQAFYEYHRVCLDKLADDAERSRAIMLSSLTSIGQVDVEYPNSMLIQIFGDTKKDEIIEIFKVADRGSKIKVKTIMVGLDASKKDKYSVLN